MGTLVCHRDRNGNPPPISIWNVSLFCHCLYTNLTFVFVYLFIISDVEVVELLAALHHLHRRRRYWLYSVYHSIEIRRINLLITNLDHLFSFLSVSPFRFMHFPHCQQQHQQINLRLILVSGKTKEFLFSPSDSAGDIALTVFENWPDGKFSNCFQQKNFKFTILDSQ